MDSNNHPYKITVLIPCKNEELYIDRVLQNIIDQDVDKSKLEVIVIDGESSDRTQQIAKKYTDQYNFISLISNPDGYVPHGLNLGIENSTGDIIVRMDAHSEYPNNYISVLSSLLFELRADNVGGSWKIIPGAETAMAKAIAIANQSPVGTGGASYRNQQTEIIEVDTVPYGCFRRDIFDKIGLFDTELIRNQDDELNARIRKNGGKIFLIPDLEIKYYARKTIGKTMKMFYQYGLFKSLVNKKLGRISSFRQLAPFFLVLMLMFIALLSLWNSDYMDVGAILIGLYVLLMVIFGLIISLKQKFLAGIILLPIVFISIHLSYGWGYLIGLVKIIFGVRTGTTTISR